MPLSFEEVLAAHAARDKDKKGVSIQHAEALCAEIDEAMLASPTPHRLQFSPSTPKTPEFRLEDCVAHLAYIYEPLGWDVKLYPAKQLGDMSQDIMFSSKSRPRSAKP